jgi:hypothetical protein
MVAVFGRAWFARHQSSLLCACNLPGLGSELRAALGIAEAGRLVCVTPDAYVVDRGDHRVAEYRGAPLFATELHRIGRPVWQLAHWFDIHIANPFCPALNLGFDTLTVYPNVNPETTSCDGYVWRSGVDESFATIIGGAGVNSLDADVDMYAYVFASTTTDQYKEIDRAVMLFDTSSLDSGATISAATISLWGLGRAGGLGQPPLHICSSAPSSNTAVVAGDYSTLGSTSFGNIAWASFVATDTTYNDITLNASGLAAITKAGVTKFGAKIEWDLNGSFTGVWASNAGTFFQFASADNASGTAHAPKLVVTFTPGNDLNAFLMEPVIGSSVF